MADWVMFAVRTILLEMRYISFFSSQLLSGSNSTLSVVASISAASSSSALAGLIFGLTEAVVFAQVTVGVAIGRNRDSDTGHHQAMRFAGRVLGHYGKNDLARGEEF